VDNLVPQLARAITVRRCRLTSALGKEPFEGPAAPPAGRGRGRVTHNVFALSVALLAILLGPATSYVNAQGWSADYYVCVDKLLQRPEALWLQQKVPIDPLDARIQQLTDSTTPTPEERDMLRSMAEDDRACRDLLFTKMPPEYAAIGALLKQADTRVDALHEALVRGSITWGQYNQGRKDSVLDFHRALAAARE